MAEKVLEEATNSNTGEMKDLEAEEKAEELYQEFLEHPFFAKEVDPTKPLNDLYKGIQDIKFEDEDLLECARNYKEEGNRYFGLKEYDVAIANYDRALEKSGEDSALTAVLLTNRAIANFYLKNYRRCINDCAKARQHNPAHVKLYRRAAAAAKELRKPKEVREWADAGLQVAADDSELRRLVADAEKLEKAQKEERRRQKVQEWKDLKTNAGAFTDLMRERGIRFEADPQFARSLPADLRVWPDEAGRLHWPLLLLYPESGNTDFLQDVHDTTRLSDCMAHVFAPGQDPPSWDPHRRYRPDTVEVYFEDSRSDERFRLSPEATLDEVARHPRMVVHAQLLCLLVVSTASEPFYSSWARR